MKILFYGFVFLIGVENSQGYSSEAFRDCQGELLGIANCKAGCQKGLYQEWLTVLSWNFQGKINWLNTIFTPITDKTTTTTTTTTTTITSKATCTSPSTTTTITTTVTTIISLVTVTKANDIKVNI